MGYHLRFQGRRLFRRRSRRRNFRTLRKETAEALVCFLEALRNYDRVPQPAGEVALWARVLQPLIKKDNASVVASVANATAQCLQSDGRVRNGDGYG